MKQRSGFIARHVAVRKVSAKRLAAEPRAKWSSITAPRKAIRSKRRTPSEMLRVYGTPERRAWIKSLPCVACANLHPLFGMATEGRSHNAHTVTGGKGRKADASTIVPLCATHHRMYDERVAPYNDPVLRDAFKAVAARLDAHWQARQDFLELSAQSATEHSA